MPDTREVDLDHLLKLRLVVARVGEMDLAKWWNTKGQLGPYGAAAVRRGFPAPTTSLRRARSLPSRRIDATRCSTRQYRHAVALAGRHRGAVRGALGALARQRERLDAVLRARLPRLDGATSRPRFGHSIWSRMRVFARVRAFDAEGRAVGPAAAGCLLRHERRRRARLRSASRAAPRRARRRRTRARRRMTRGRARQRRLVLHGHQGRDDRRDLRRLRSVGLRASEAREPRPAPRENFIGAGERDVAARRRRRC